MNFNGNYQAKGTERRHPLDDLDYDFQPFDKHYQLQKVTKKSKKEKEEKTEETPSTKYTVPVL